MYLIAVLLILGITLQNVVAVTVIVEQGILKGEKMWTVTGDTSYYSFKGIPYAAPPTGNLRFKVSQPPLPWQGIRDATKHGNVCPQVNRLDNTYTPGSEDCLYLNVYTPRLNPHYLSSVMFFIHGGGYEIGSGNDDNYGPDFLMDQNGIVLVTINYRLDTLGFLCLDSEEVPGNIGLKDQVAALRWVNRNIEKFGGDPKKVTIFGQSAGGSSCTLHAVSPMSKGLFHRVIAMSGVPISEFSIEYEPKQRALTFGKILGFETDNTTALLEYLQNMPVRPLLGTNSSIIAAEEYIDHIVKVYFVPVVEKDFGQERFLIEPPDVSVKNGRTNDVDILLGYTTAEAIAFLSTFEDHMIRNYNRYKEALVPRSVFYDSTPRLTSKLADFIKNFYIGSQAISLKTIRQFENYVTDLYIYDVIRCARHLSDFNKKNKTYLYQFSCLSERNVLSKQGIKYGIIGVAHTDDLMYVFNAKQYNLTVNKKAPSYKMIQQTCALFTNFAIFGNPIPDLSMGVKWPQYNTESQMYLDIGEELKIGMNPKASMMTFWKKIFVQTGLPF